MFSQVLQNFMEPLQQLLQKDLTEIAKHQKKLEGRRLDYDYKRTHMKPGSKITETDIKAAEMKVGDSLDINTNANVINVINNHKIFALRS